MQLEATQDELQVRRTEVIELKSSAVVHQSIHTDSDTKVRIQFRNSLNTT